MAKYVLVKSVLSTILGIFFINVGIAHFTDTEWFEPIVPDLFGNPTFWIAGLTLFQLFPFRCSCPQSFYYFQRCSITVIGAGVYLSEKAIGTKGVFVGEFGVKIQENPNTAKNIHPGLIYGSLYSVQLSVFYTTSIFWSCAGTCSCGHLYFYHVFIGLDTPFLFRIGCGNSWRGCGVVVFVCRGFRNCSIGNRIFYVAFKHSSACVARQLFCAHF